jgi:ubiquinone/menaquinone biosynthesis C-methylase UbiE
MKEVEDDRVVEEFDRRATLFPDENAVLAWSETGESWRQNVYLDYVSRCLAQKYLKPGKTDTILDFGCGVGRLSMFLSPLVGMIVGIDSSSRMLAVAQRQLQARRIRNVHYLQAGRDGCPLATGAVDKIITCWVLAHVSDGLLREVLSEFRRILAPSGQLVAFEQVRPTRESYAGLHVQRTADEYGKLIEAAGLHVRAIRPVLRHPSYGRWLWRRFSRLSASALPLLAMLEAATVTRKPKCAEYWTSAFVATP